MKKGDSNFLIFVLVFIAFVIVTLLLTFYFILSTGEKIKMPQGADNLVLPTTSGVLQDALSKNNIDLCQNTLLTQQQKNDCQGDFYFDKFRKTGDLSYCDKIISFQKKIECQNYDAVKFNAAVSANDKSLCDEVINSNKRQECINSIESSNLQIPGGNQS